MSASPRIFVSYSYDDDNHRDWVRNLAERLRDDGVDARLDQWHLRQSTTIPEFMNREVRRADKLLVVCTPIYQAKVHAKEEGELVTGSGYEGMLISANIFENPKTVVVPVLARGIWVQAAPSFLKSLRYFDLSDTANWDWQYDKLLDVLLDREPTAPPLGPSKENGPQQKRASHNLPFFPRSFVGRKEESQRLYELIHPAERPHTSGKRPWVAIKGMGGIGKTHFALNYSWSHREAYETICWVNAAGEDITAAVAELESEPLSLGLPINASVAEKVAAVKNRLAKGGPHLIVFDNVDHPGSFVPFIPAGAPLHVLVTSRREDLTEVDTAFELKPLSESEVMYLLQGESEWPPEEEQAARELSELFGRLTLLLALAGRLMKSRSWWPSKLLSRVKREGGPLAWSTTKLPPDHLFQTDPNLLHLFDASVDLLNPKDEIDEVALKVLHLGGWLARSPIPPLLFKELVLPYNSSEADFDLLEDALARLVDVGLATMELRPAIIFHLLVADYAREKGGEGPRSETLHILAKTVRGLPPNAAIIPVPGLGGLSLAELEPHLLCAFDLLKIEILPALGWIPFRLAESKDAAGNTSEAIRILKRADSVKSDKLWKARFQAMLGQLFADDGHHEEAKQALELAYPVLQSELGQCDTDSIVAGVTLAKSLDALQRPDEALKLLHFLNTKCGDLKHPAPAGSLARSTAARVLAAQGRIEDALVQLVQAMAIDKVSLPPISYQIYEPAEIAFVEMFAAYALAGDPAAMNRVLNFANKIFGTEWNPTIVTAQHQAGMKLLEQNRYKEALNYLESALIGVEKLYKPNSDESGATNMLLGKCLLRLDRPEEAVGHLKKALSIAEAQFEQGDWRIKQAKQLLDEAQSA